MVDGMLLSVSLYCDKAAKKDQGNFGAAGAEMLLSQFFCVAVA